MSLRRPKPPIKGGSVPEEEEEEEEIYLRQGSTAFHCPCVETLRKENDIYTFVA